MIGCVYTNVQDRQYQKKNEQLKSSEEYIAVITSNPVQNEYSLQYEVKIQKVGKNKTNIKVYLKVKQQNKLGYGDIVCFKGEYAEPNVARNDKGFDYKQYLKSKGIIGIITTNQVKVIGKENPNLWQALACRLQKVIENQIRNKILNKDYQDVLLGIILGNDENIEQDIKDNFKSSSLSHILAVSGMHVAYIVSFVDYLLVKFKIGKQKTKIVTIIFLAFFILLTNNTPSVRRACIMSILGIISILINRKNDIINSMAIALIVTLIQNPFSIFDTGLILSYSATLGIILLNPILLPKKDEKHITFQSRLIQNIKSIVVVSVSAQIAILPISIYLFQTISLTFIFSNLFVSLIIGLIIMLGFIISIPVEIPFLSNIISRALNILLFLLVEGSQFFTNISLSHILICPPNVVIIVIYYVVVLFLIYIKRLIKKENKRRAEKRILTNVDKFKCFIFKRKIKLIAIICLLMICLKIINILPCNLIINFIDVGQGDCTLIVTPHHKNILIDGGGNSDTDRYDVGKSVLLPYLLSHGIKKLDIIIISHFDSDHVGGILTILKELKVDQVIISKQGEKSENYEQFAKIINEKNINVRVVRKGEVINIEKNLHFNVLWPLEKPIQENVLNNNSLVLKLNYKKFSMLLTGDIESIAEKEILNYYSGRQNILKANVLKVAHHGSKSSSTQIFLEQVKPTVALIGVGQNNKFGHPNKEVLERLESFKTKIYRTDKMGEIILRVNTHGNIKIRTKL